MNLRFLWRKRNGRLVTALACVGLAALSGGALLAQTVQPLIDENVVKGAGKRASGKIEYMNDSLDTLAVTLDARSFTVSDTGELSYRPLDAGIHLKLSTMSFRIPPKQSYLVFYEASADAVPAWFVVYASFSGFHERTQDGLRIQIELPHTIYLLPKEAIKKEELSVKTAEYHPDTKQIVVRVENDGPNFGRVLEADATAGGSRATQGGFAIFPHSEREVEFPWENAGEPRKLVLRLNNFKLEQELRSASP